jgi:hypothetical protein
MTHTVRSRARIGGLLLPLALLGCGSDEPTGEFPPLYYAVAYGTVEQGGAPVTGAEVLGEVYLVPCPPSGAPTSNNAIRSGAGGRYRLLLASADSAAGQCLRLRVGGGTPVLRTLDDLPFSATIPADVRDSVQIDLTLP